MGKRAVTVFSLVALLLLPSFSSSGEELDIFAPPSADSTKGLVDSFFTDQESPTVQASPSQIPQVWRGTKLSVETGLDSPVKLHFRSEEEGEVSLQMSCDETGLAGVKVSRSKIMNEATPFEKEVLKPKLYALRSGTWGALELIVKSKKASPWSSELLICPYVRKVTSTGNSVEVGLYPSSLTPYELGGSFFARASAKFRSAYEQPGKLVIALHPSRGVTSPRELKDSIIGKDPELSFSYQPVTTPQPIPVPMLPLREGLGIKILRELNPQKKHTVLQAERISLVEAQLPEEYTSKLSLRRVREQLRCFVFTHERVHQEQYE